MFREGIRSIEAGLHFAPDTGFGVGGGDSEKGMDEEVREKHLAWHFQHASEFARALLVGVWRMPEGDPLFTQVVAAYEEDKRTESLFLHEFDGAMRVAAETLNVDLLIMRLERSIQELCRSVLFRHHGFPLTPIKSQEHEHAEIHAREHMADQIAASLKEEKAELVEAEITRMVSASMQQTRVKMERFYRNTVRR